MKPPSRRYERVSVALEARMESKPVQIANLSRGGAFIRGLSAGNLYDTVSLTLNGRKIAAQIRWVRGSGETGFGLQFDVELEPETFLALTGNAG